MMLKLLPSILILAIVVQWTPNVSANYMVACERENEDITHCTDQIHVLLKAQMQACVSEATGGEITAPVTLAEGATRNRNLRAIASVSATATTTTTATATSTTTTTPSSTSTAAEDDTIVSRRLPDDFCDTQDMDYWCQHWLACCMAGVHVFCIYDNNPCNRRRDLLIEPPAAAAGREEEIEQQAAAAAERQLNQIPEAQVIGEVCTASISGLAEELQEQGNNCLGSPPNMHCEAYVG